MNEYFITYTGKGWELQKRGATRASKRAGTKTQLLEITDTFMAVRTGTVKVYNCDGTVEERTYLHALDSIAPLAGERAVS